MTRDDLVLPPDQPPPPPTDAETPPPDPNHSWWDDLLRTKHGDVKPTYGNVYSILENHPETRGVLVFDEHAYRVGVMRRPPWASVSDPRSFPATLCEHRDGGRCVEWLQRNGGTQAPWAKRTVLEAMVDVAHVFAVDPVRSYLESLQWDGVERCEDWLSDYCGADNTTLNRAIAKRWLISAVARIFDPGVKADCILVLEGKTGAKKSTTIRTLAANPRWFKDEVIPVTNQKEAALMIQGAWIFEIAEFAAFRRVDQSKVKPFLSRQIDSYRPVYGQFFIERPRRTVFAATTEDDQYLTDPLGGRRYWSVKVADQINLRGLAAVRDQLWAEAVHWYRRGTIVPPRRGELDSGVYVEGTWWFAEEELQALHADAIEDRREVSSLEDFLLEWTNGRDRFSTAEAIHDLSTRFEKLTINGQTDHNIADALRSLGFTQTRRDAAGNLTGRKWIRKPRRSERRATLQNKRARARARQLAFTWRRRAVQCRFAFAA